MCVSVYVSRANDEGQPWQLFARHKAHYGKIEGTIRYNVRPATLSPACQCMIHQLMLYIYHDIKIFFTHRFNVWCETWLQCSSAALHIQWQNYSQFLTKKRHQYWKFFKFCFFCCFLLLFFFCCRLSMIYWLAVLMIWSCWALTGLSRAQCPLPWHGTLSWLRNHSY